MKLIIGDKVYLQKYDVTFIFYRLNEYPANLFYEILNGNGVGYYSMEGSIDAFRFDCSFEDYSNKKWLMEQDWLVDYDEYIKIPLQKLEDKIQRLRVKCIDNVTIFNSKEEPYRREHFKEACNEYHKLDHKLASLENLMAARKGKISFIFPEEYHR